MTRYSILLSIALTVGLLASMSKAQDVARLESELQTTILPLLEDYCIDCHAPGEMKDLDFLSVKSLEDARKLRDIFATVVEQMESKSMPPSRFDQPTQAEHQQVTQWIREALKLKPEDTDRIGSYVIETFEDRSGNLWLGTINHGVARKNSEGIVYFSTEQGLPSNAVPSICEDRNGTLWVGTQQGVARFNGKSFEKLDPSLHLPPGDSRVTSDRKGNLWAGTNAGIFRFDGTEFVRFDLPIEKDKISSYAIVAGRGSLAMQDRSGNLWFKTDGAGAFRYDGKDFKQFTAKDGLPSNNVTGILEDQSGNIWFTCMQSYQPKMTGDGGICRYDGTDFQQFPTQKGLTQNDIYTVYETRSGNIWIGASGVGAYRFDGTNFTLFDKTTHPYWTRNFGLQSVKEDRKGTLWFGFSGGLFRFNGESFLSVGKEGPWTGTLESMGEQLESPNVLNSKLLHPRTQAGLASVAQDDFDKALNTLRDLKSKNPSERTIQETTLNELGYQLVFDGRLDKALKIFKLNNALYPNSFNTFDSLAEAYLRIGDEENAILHYQKSLELNPKNKSASQELIKIAAKQKYESILLTPEGWLEEVLISPPRFAPTLALKGLEHLRLPPDFRDVNSKWFCSYYFALELSEPVEFSPKVIADQLLIYYRGLAGDGLDPDSFTIEDITADGESEFVYTLNWREPFSDEKHEQAMRLRVKLMEVMTSAGVIYVCASPQPFDSDVWEQLLKERDKFEEAAKQSGQ